MYYNKYYYDEANQLVREDNRLGDFTSTYSYDVYGNYELIPTGNDAGSVLFATILSGLNPLSYRGYIFTPAIGISHYLQLRYYDPVTCRFVNVDAFVSTGTGILGHNMFVYCGNNPVVYVDFSGTAHVPGIDACGGAIITYSKPKIIANTYYSQTKNDISFNSLYFNVDEGDSYTISANNEETASLIFFNQVAHEYGSFFDNKIGINMNIKNGGARVDIGLLSSSVAICANNTSLEFFNSPDMAGVTIAFDVNYKKLTASKYIQVYVRPMPILCTAMVVCCVPQSIYFIASYFIQNVSCYAYT